MKHPIEPQRISRRNLLKTGGAALAVAALGAQATRAESSDARRAESFTGEHWPRHRARIERAWLDLLGDFPVNVPALQPVVKKVTLQPGCPSELLTAEQRAVLREQMAKEDGAIERYHVSFQAEEDDRVVAWLLVPRAARRQPTPAMICIHSTTHGSGKNLTIGLSGSRPFDPPDDDHSERGRAYGRYLAQHGFVTLSLDILTDGERVAPGARRMDSRAFYVKHPEWSVVGKLVWDVMRCVDFLQTLDFVDDRHIGCVGLSLGGHAALFAGAFDQRIAATISNGGVLDWVRNTPHWAASDAVGNSPRLITRHGYDPETGPHIYIRKFRPYIADPSKPIPVDFDELMMMVAPRPLLILSSEWEFYNRRNLLQKCLSAARVYVEWKDLDGLPSALEARLARRGYQTALEYYRQRFDMTPERMRNDLGRVGAGDCISWYSFPAGHSYPALARNYSFTWLDRWLGRDLNA
jgi:dienelactone hydrolase